MTQTATGSESGTHADLDRDGTDTRADRNKPRVDTAGSQPAGSDRPEASPGNGEPSRGSRKSLASARAALQQLLRAGGRVPVWSARLVFLLGLVNVASGVLPKHRGLFDWSIDLLPPLGVASVSVIAIGVGFGLLTMARGLRQRKRRAWRAVVTLLSLGVGIHIARGTDHIQTVISAAVVAVLIVCRGQFVGRPDPRSRRSVPAVFAVMVVGTWMAGFVVTLSERRDLAPGWRVSSVLGHTFLGLVGVTGPLRFTNDAAATENSVVLLGLGIITAVVTIGAFLKSSNVTMASSAEDQARIRYLLHRHGAVDSLGYFATRDDKSYVFSDSGKAAVAYRVLSGVCLAAGDPVGDVEAWPAAIEAWLLQARERAWIPAVVAASETGAEIYRRIGLDALEIGDEAVVETAEFTLDGRPMRSVRQAVNRARRAGYVTVLHRVADVDPDRLQDLDQTSARWRSSQQPERGFSMALSRFGAASDGRCLVVEARSPSGDLVALLQFVPWGEDGLSLDLMRRHPALENGVMELIIADVLAAARRQGISRVSLNFAMFRASLARGERIGAGPFLRAWFQLLLFFSRWWQIASLYRANAKFRPSWEPRFICFAQARDLGPIVYAALRAEGFLNRPQPLAGWRRSRQRRSQVDPGAGRP